MEPDSPPHFARVDRDHPGRGMPRRLGHRSARHNIVGGDIAEVRHKLAVLRGHCDEAGRDYDTIEKSHVQHWLLARDAAAVAAKRERLAARGPLRGFLGTVSEAIDLIGQYQDAGVELLINSDQRNDEETRELFVSDVMPHFA